MRFFDFIEKHNGIGLAANLFCQLTAFIVPHISGRRTDQTGHRMPFHIFGHIDSDHGVFVAKHGFCQRFTQFRFANASRTQEQETADGAFGIFQADTTTANGTSHSLYGLVLTYDPFVKGIFHMQQTLTFVLGKTCHRDAGPVGHNSGNVLFGHIPVLFIALAALTALGLQLFLIVLFGIP